LTLGEHDGIALLASAAFALLTMGTPFVYSVSRICQSLSE